MPAEPLTIGDTSIPAVPATGADGLPAEQRCVGVVARTLGFIVDATLICIPSVNRGVRRRADCHRGPPAEQLEEHDGGGGRHRVRPLGDGLFRRVLDDDRSDAGRPDHAFRVVPRTGDELKTRRAIVRAIGLVLAAIPLFAGYLPIAIGRKHRGLQDYLARTIVVDAPEQSVADTQRIAAQANRTRTLILSGEATYAPDGHAPHDGDQIALDPVRRNVASSDSGDAGGSGA